MYKYPSKCNRNSFYFSQLHTADKYSTAHFEWLQVFSVGQLFIDYFTLEKEVKHFETSNFVKLSKSDCRKISASAANFPDKTFNEGVVCSQLKLSCCHGGKADKSRSRGDRLNQTTGKIGCRFVLRLKATKYGQALDIMQLPTNIIMR